MKIYLAGKMRGLPNFQRDKFMEAAAKLRSEGHEVFNPIEAGEKIYGASIYLDNPTGDEEGAGVDGRLVLGNDLAFICAHANAVALLPGWQNSKGAFAEHAVAEALGLQVMYL